MKTIPGKPLLSIVTVCRNKANRIQATIDSVAAQTDQGFEWIVVDGASTDGTRELLQSQQEKFSRILSEPDSGLYAAMNKGIGLASGEYLLFLNAGDTLENNSVVQAFKQAHFTADLVVGDIRVVYPGRGEQYRSSHAHALDSNLLYWRTFPHPSTFIARRLFTRFGPYDLSFQILADWEFFVRVVTLHGASAHQWSHCVAVFTNDGISASPANRARLHREQALLRRKHYPLGYRLRREFNDTWGILLHRLRETFKLVPSS